MCVCKTSSWQVEYGESRVQGQSLPSELEPALEHNILYQMNKQTKKQNWERESKKYQYSSEI